VDWVINRVLSAPTLDSSPKNDFESTSPLAISDLLLTDDASNETTSALTNVLNIDRQSNQTKSGSLFSNLLRGRQSIEDPKLINFSKFEFLTLSRQIKAYRTKLSFEERMEFDGKFAIKVHISLYSAVFSDLISLDSCSSLGLESRR